MTTKKLTKRLIDALSPTSGTYFIWDVAPKGLGIRVTKTGVKSFVFQYRLKKGRYHQAKRMTIGRYGSPWTVEMARNEALRLGGMVASGENPNQKYIEDNKDLSVSELCTRYLKEGLGIKKASTIATDKGRINRLIIPLIGKKRINSITKAELQKFHDNVVTGKGVKLIEKAGSRGVTIVKGGKGTAARTIGLLGAIFQFAVNSEFIEHNPVRGVKRFKDNRRERFLTTSEITEIAEALAQLENQGKSLAGITIIKLLMLTGARRGEIEKLKWNEINEANKCLQLADSKTGQKTIHLNTAAMQLLNDWKQLLDQEYNYVFPSLRGDSYYSGIPKIWKKVKEITNLDDLRIHDLRHTFASIGIAQGSSIQILGALLGHKDIATTQRYAHLQDDPIKKANELIGDEIATALKL